MAKKTTDGWKVDIRPYGADGPRKRKVFATKGEATSYENYWLAQSQKEYEPRKKDTRRLSELVELWFGSHGTHLGDGERRKTCLLSMSKTTGNPIAQSMSPSHFTDYRSARMTEKEHAISAKTANNHHGYINAVFNELHQLEVIDYANPLSKIKAIKIKEKELHFLTFDQIDELLNTIETNAQNPHVLLITRICLATGCRWSEAENLHRRNVKGDKITFTDTKSGKNRAVPISKALAQEIDNHGEGQLFTSALGAFRRALAKTDIELPAGQASHVLRHSFASHFIMNGGDILTLQKILGHSSLAMTMRYAHLAPDHLDAARRFNPLDGQNMDNKKALDPKSL